MDDTPRRDYSLAPLGERARVRGFSVEPYLRARSLAKIKHRIANLERVIGLQ
jgi:hypothetical protein